jgi:hypothetical protein
MPDTGAYVPSGSINETVYIPDVFVQTEVACIVSFDIHVVQLLENGRAP